MGCKSCTTGGCGTQRGASDGPGGEPQKTATGGCGSGGCGTGGCNKLNSFDWLSDIAMPGLKYDVVEVKFKGGRKEYYRNVHQLDLTTGDYVVVEMQSGFHIGAVSLQGELVRLQVKKKGVKINDDTKVIHRLTTPKDMERHEQAILRDLPALYRSREIIRELKLNMKLSDVEFQSDNTKATFYYSSEERVDFRELIKMLASEFKARIEMRQISLRQEAGRLGGIGSCGRELCCSTWLTDFKNIATSAARYQNLSLNPAKLSGQCGRLKCCLNYELDTYIDALRDIPTIDKPLETQKGRAYLQKTDIFRKLMWFGYGTESTWYPLAIERVLEIAELNKRGIIPESFDVLTPIGEKEPATAAALNSDLQKLDAKYATRTSKKKKKKPKGAGDKVTKPLSNGKAQ
ncbi:PSP1 domain-containing protein [Spirosoma oryzicola]|uniref:Signal peptidase-like protein n=1 Tax=Spirosoma liriopis TaxID=2937440 RepID=A0ABT0HIL9_9BACT|nr:MULTISPECIES: regulatory iron-sulfur-containing complex subunit RicT [Spirosoma]MCK8491845.1 Signal peptidase-like protein [Spirosoma liriopis]UHG91167.1 Signal peptidase-like protein [Spirosoma oryzicola]